MTLSLVREVGFTSLFGFKYSPRPLTPALKLTDDVPEEVKSERLARLFEVADDLTGAHLASLVGTRQRVLVEGASKSGDRVEGRTEQNEIVHLQAPPERDLAGVIVEVEIARANKHSLEGTLTGAALAALPARAPGARSAYPDRPARRALPLVTPLKPLLTPSPEGR